MVHRAHDGRQYDCSLETLQVVCHFISVLLRGEEYSLESTIYLSNQPKGDNMQSNYPSIETLMRVNRDETSKDTAKLARTILKATTREELEELPVYEQYYQKIGRQLTSRSGTQRLMKCN